MLKKAVLKKAGLTLAVLGALVTSFSAQALEPLRVAADPVPHAQILTYIQKLDPQLNLKVIEIPQGVNSNELLVHGDVDANYFQHLPYLQSQEKALGEKLAVAATVHIEPLGIYSHRHKTFAQVPDKGTVAVPNNVTNLSRALYLLQDNGLIKLKPGFNDPAADQATPKDIAENPKHLKILEIESPQLPRALDDVDLAVINGNYALEAGIDTNSALIVEKGKSLYIEFLVARPDNINDPGLQKLAKALNSDEVRQFILTRYKGQIAPGF